MFDNPVRVFSLDELAATVRKLERERPGRAVEELSGAVFAELAIKRTQRAADLVAEAIRLARAASVRHRDRRLAVAGQHLRSQELGPQRRLRTRRRWHHPRPGHHRIQPDTPGTVRTELTALGS